MLHKILQTFVKNNKLLFSSKFNHLNLNKNSKGNIDIKDIPSLNEFLQKQQKQTTLVDDQDLNQIGNQIVQNKKFFIETYGCQMNSSDTEIINSLLLKEGFQKSLDISDSDIILLNTCAIREGAEQKIWKRLQELRAQIRKNKNQQLIIGVLGCMAERLKEKLVEKNKIVDLIVGPDSYRDLPRLINSIIPGDDEYAINVQLSLDETYANVVPVRQNNDSKLAFVSIMRGCNNMCSFCIVPFTRGRERSRSYDSIINEVNILKNQQVKEITFLGQNVNSYYDESKLSIQSNHKNSKGFQELYKLRGNEKGARFAQLLEGAASEAPNVRFRFTSPHPKDFTDEVINVIKTYPNVCKYIHMPVQSGNNQVLDRMRRNYTREAYLDLIGNIRREIQGITISTDIICGFCGETEEEFNDTADLMQSVKFDSAFIFAYSMREKTHAHRRMIDDVPQEVKMKRLYKLNEILRKNQEEKIKEEVGRIHLILIDSLGKKDGQMRGKTDTNIYAVVDQQLCPSNLQKIDIKNMVQNINKNNQFNIHGLQMEKIEIGDYIMAQVQSTSIRTLFCKPIAKVTIDQFSTIANNNPYISKSKILI